MPDKSAFTAPLGEHHRTAEHVPAASSVASLVLALANPATRNSASDAIARFAGADCLIVLVTDGERRRFIPAPGFPPTLPGGSGWRALLVACATPGRHVGDVLHPTTRQPVRAVAEATQQIAAVFVGDATDATRVSRVWRWLHPLTFGFVAEQAAAAARGELQVAREAARSSEGLARALDAARRELESKARSLEDAVDRAERSGRAKDEFLAMLGHELRNPLAPIVTAVHLMRAKGMSSRELTIIERQLAHLSRLIDDLLDVARVARGKMSLRRENLEIATVVDRAIEMAAPLLEQKQQRLEIDVPRTGLLVNGDATRLAQVVANLLTNAAKYSPPRSPVRLSARQESGRILVRCEDEGIGIAPERLERVFDMFFQEPQALDRGQGGLGLGLSIVRSFVRLHGGDVRCHSDGNGRGSVFIIELPAASDPQPRSAPPAESGTAAASVPGRRRVLVVDDNKDSAELVAEALASKGCDVLIAFDGPQALKLAADRSPDVVVLDIGLPVMDGYEVAVRLRAERRSELPPVRLIALTGYGQKEDARRAARAGFDQHLVKPVDIDRLVEIVGS